MIFKTYASGSKGNFYEVFDGKTRLMIECGLNVNKLQKLCGFSLNSYDAALVTHEHGDHSKAMGELIKRGMRVYASQGTFNAVGETGYILQSEKQTNIGTFIVLPFATIHDAIEPLGFLIKSRQTGDKLLFVTDTASIGYKFKGITHMAIECNHSKKLIQDSPMADKIKQRITHTHLSLEKVIAFLQDADLTKLRQIELIHLSSKHADEELFKRIVSNITGIKGEQNG